MIKPVVLLFDIDRAHKMLYNALAEQFGWDVVIVSIQFSATAPAVQLMHLPTIDAIVMAMDGNEIHDFKFLRWLHKAMNEQHCYVPVLAATAYALPEERERCMNAGVDAYLSKPFTKDQLEENVIELIRRFPNKKRSSSRG